MTIAANLSEQEALAQFQEQYPAVGSIRAIATLSLDEFGKNYAIAFEGGIEQAKQVYQLAFTLNEKAILVWGNLKDTVASPFFPKTLFNNVPESFTQYQQSISDYERLFNKQLYQECEDCRSILSPAAYFVDLMRFVGKILENSDVPEGCDLLARRPDLWTTPLDCENTNEMIPYIDLVNEVLEQFTKNAPNNFEGQADDIYRRLARARHPLNLPFNLPLQEIRTYFKPLKTSLYAVYETFRPLLSDVAERSLTVPEPAPALAIDLTNPQAALIREILELSPMDLEMLTAPISAAELAETYNVDSLSEQNFAGLDQVKCFLNRTGLTRRELDHLLFQDLDRAEVALGWAQQLFIYQGDPALPPIKIEQRDAQNQTEEVLRNLSLMRLDRIGRFLRLSRRLGWSFADLDWALRSLQPEQLPDRVLRLDGDGDYIACRTVKNLDLTTFTIAAQVCPLRAGINPILFKGTEGTNALHFLLYLDAANRLRFKTASAEYSSADPLPLGELTHLIVAVSAEGVSFNGKPGVLQTEAWQPIEPVGSDLNIGKSHHDQPFYFNGFIQEVQIWQGAQAISTGGDRASDLLGYWKLDPDSTDLEAQGLLCLDATASQNHGVLIRQNRYLSRSHEGDSPFVPAPWLTHEHDRVLLVSDFAAGLAQPQDWQDTAANFSIDSDTRNFRILSDEAGSRAFGTESIANHLHSHYVGADASSWSNYEFSGRLRASDVNAGIGVTALSSYPQTRQYYRLRSIAGSPFELVFRTANNIDQLPMRGGTLPILRGVTSSTVMLEANVWFRFRLRVEDTGNATRIQAKVWQENTPEPEAFQVDAIDAADDRLRQGTIGVWTQGSGTKLFDDFRVVSLPIATGNVFTLSTLANLAAIKLLQARTNRSIAHLAALWHAPKFIGREDGQTWFDQLFNPSGVSQTRWSYPLDRPLRLTLSAADEATNPEQERQIRTRLMSALRISQDDLHRLVQWVGGKKTAITLDTLALTRLYQLAETARLLLISISELLLLLDYLKLRQVSSLPLLLRLQAIVEQLRQAKFSIAEFTLLLQPADNPLLARVAEVSVQSLAATLWQQRRELMGQPQAAIDAAVVTALTSVFDVPQELLQVILTAPTLRLLDRNQLRAGLAIEQPDAASLQNLTSCFYTVQRLLSLINKLNLTPAETTLLLTQPEALGVLPLPLTMAALARLSMFKQLQTELKDDQGQLLAWLQLPADRSAQELAAAIVPLTRWEPRQLSQLVDYFGRFEAAGLSRVEWLQRLHHCFKLAQSIGVNVSFLIELANPQTHNFDGFRQQAANLLKVLRSIGLDREAWKKTEKPLHSELALKKRDALLSLALLKLGEGTIGRKDPHRLYEFLLIDPQMGSEVQTSRVVQAIASVQLYVQRCLLNLEVGVNPETIALEQWEWMKNYRVWEANRKVFLYPENYIEPELRGTKTPLFEALEQELMQGEMTADRVEEVYTNYLDKFKEIADLQIVGSYLHRDHRSDDPEDQGILYLIGCTKTQPRIFYYRTLIVATDRWTPWIKIELTINSAFVTPVIAFRRLFIFWVEFGQTKSTIERKATEEEKKNPPEGRYVGRDGFLYSTELKEVVRDAIDIYKPVIKFSYYNFGKTWVQPQTYLELPNVLSETEHLLTQWQRVYAQTAQEFAPDLAENSNFGSITPSTLSEKTPKVLQVDQNSEILRTLENFDSDALSLAVWFSADYLLNNKSKAVSEADARRELVNPIVLLNLNNGQIKISVVNGVGSIATISQLDLSAFANTRAAINLAQQGVNAINQLATEGFRQQPSDIASNAILQIDRLAQLVQQELFKVEYNEHRQRLDTALQFVRGAAEEIKTFLQNWGVETDPAWRQQRVQFAQGSVNRALNAFNQVQPASDNSFRWQPAGLKLQIQIGNETIESSVEALSWHYFVLSMQYDNARQGYNVRLYSDPLSSTPQFMTPRFISIPRLPESLEVAIAQQSPNVRPSISLQLSDVALWARQMLLLEAQKNQSRRKAASETALYLPLNRSIPRMQLQLVDARPGLTFVTLPQDAIEATRERLLIFYGGSVNTLRNNLTNDKSFQLSFKPTDNQYSYDLDLSPTRLEVTLTKGLSLNDYAEVDSTTPVSRATPVLIQEVLKLQQALRAAPDPISQLMLKSNLQVLQAMLGSTVDPISYNFKQANPLLSALPNLESILYDVGNQPGWYIFSTDSEQFLIRLVDSKKSQRPKDLKATQDRLQLTYENSSGNNLTYSVSIDINSDRVLEAVPKDNQPSSSEFQTPPYKFQFVRLNSFAVQSLSESLFAGGVDALLSLESQYTPERTFSHYQPNRALVDATQVSSTIDFNGANGLYYWEIFFHIPFLIANRLNAKRQFDDAQRWYHYLFNPTAQEEPNSAQSANQSDRYWRFLPFRSREMMSLEAIVSDKQALAEYREDPGDPHAIARLRPCAYQKAIVMKYIDNLLDWGDNLFEKDDRESINEAIMLYVLGYALLGPKPELRPVEKFVEVGTYWHIEQRYRNSSLGIPEFLVDLDTGSSTAGSGSNQAEVRFNPHNTLELDFCAPENEQFMKYWDRVEDRLYKIRHSLSIEGIFRQLALFAPEIDPAALVQSIAGGQGLDSALADQDADVPYFRFNLLLDKAKDMASTAIDLGAALLSVLQSKDAEQLAVLQNNQEEQIHDLTLQVKQAEVETAEAELEALQVSKEILGVKIGYYTLRISYLITPAESLELLLRGSSLNLRIPQSGMHILSSIAFMIPKAEGGVSGVAASPRISTQFGGDNSGNALSQAADIFGVLADMADTGAELAGKVAEYERRTFEWIHELTQAGLEMKELDKKIAVSELQIKKAKHELTVQEKQIEHSRQVAEFYRSKFTNQELYGWMISRLSMLQFQAYMLAYSMAKSAEKALKFELPTQERFIKPVHWDTSRKGILAGESLLVELQRMEKFNLDQDQRWLSVQKKISLKQLRSLTHENVLEQLKAEGKCEFKLTEALFDRDYHGHYCRQIKTIGMSVHVAADGLDNPYDSIHATLTQTKSKVLLKPDIQGLNYLMNETAAKPDRSILREDWRSKQQIAISTVETEPYTSKTEADVGIFNLDFVFDNAYFPFENTGAVSDWLLEVPKETNSSFLKFDKFDRITDVVIHLRYTARSDSGMFRTEVSNWMAKSTS